MEALLVVGARWKILQVALQLAILVGVCLLWQYAVSSRLVDGFFTSSPEGIWRSLDAWARNGQLWSNAASTLYAALIGYVLGTLSGVLLGTLLGVSPMFRAYASPFVAFFNGIPRVIMAPFFIIWLGFGIAPKIVLVVFVLIFIVATNVDVAFQNVDGEVLKNVRILGGSRLNQFRHVYIPSVVGTIIATSRLTLGYSLSVTVVAEFIGSSRGMGVLIALGQDNFQVNDVMAGILVVMIIVVIGDRLLSMFEKRATRWTM